MNEFGDFHDGLFEGLWIDGTTAHIFLASHVPKRFVIVASMVAELIFNDVKSGNIIYDVLIQDSEEVGAADLRALYTLKEGTAGEAQAQRLLEKVRLEQLKLLEINPSYGASGLALAATFELLPREDWQRRFQSVDQPS
jgi:hypothetical protein